MLRIAIVAAEPSGDILGADLMAALLKQRPDIEFEGIGGQNMQAVGCRSLVEMEKLSIMGLVEVLKHLPELLKIRRGLIQRWIENPPDIFIGIDAPDFNLKVETILKKAGIPTVHYVSPTLWAWREGRSKKLKAATDLVLAIFPFEEKYLANLGIHARYIGHSLADKIAHQSSVAPARKILNLPLESEIIAILPGSRMGELKFHSEIFIETADRLHQNNPQRQFIANFANQKTKDFFQQQLKTQAPHLPIHCYQQQTAGIFAAANVALVASGTVTLEGLLVGRPMVVGYRVNPITLWIVRQFNLFKIKYAAMVNILADQCLAVELLHENCIAKKLTPAIEDLFEHTEQTQHIQQQYEIIRQQLKQDAGKQGAKAVLDLLVK